MRRISRATAIILTAALLFGFSAGALVSSESMTDNAQKISAIN